ncbi:hypothetical protein GCM10010377_23900 [Streptomyces viridiviolaceus]|nr:hypothetical protein GCM10010377_23900 [Streptomyces viridiviolaceus]
MRPWRRWPAAQPSSSSARDRYIRTSEPVISACLEAKVPHPNFDADVESTQHALRLADKAQDAAFHSLPAAAPSPA